MTTLTGTPQAFKFPRLARRAISPTAPPVTPPRTSSLIATATAEYAKANADGVAPAMMRTIRRSTWFNLLIIALIMSVTYPHVALFLDSRNEFGQVAIHNFTIKFAWVVPLIFDLSILSDIIVLVARVMKQSAKNRHMITLAVAGAASIFLNVAAPASLFTRIIFGALVLMMVLRKWASSEIGPDFNKMGEVEIEAQAAVAPSVPDKDPVRVAAAIKGNQTKAAQRQRDLDRKETRRIATQMKAAEKAAELATVATLERDFRAPSAVNAPVSPASGEWREYL